METDPVRGSDGREYRSVLALSAAFVAIFTAYLAVQNLQSSLNAEHGLGVISLSCMYACIIVSGILAPSVIRVIGEKKALLASFVTHVIYTGSNFYPRFATLLPSSILIGLTAGPMWTAQSVYLAEKASSYSRRKHVDTHSTLSRFNGLFFGMYECTQITGNLISSLVLRQGVSKNGDGDNTTAIVKTCGRQDCPLEGNSTAIEEPSTQVIYTLLGVFLVCDIIGLIVTLFFLPPLRRPQGSADSGLVKSLASCGRTLLDPQLAMLVPLIMFTAMEQGILWTDYTKSYISCPVGIQQVGFVMATYGASTTVFALSFSRLVHFTGRYVMFAAACVINMGILVVLYVWMPEEEHIVFIYIIPAVWGIAEGIWQTQTNALFALLFPEKKDSAFANYHTWKATAFTFTFVFGYFLCVSAKLIIAMALLAVAMVLYVVVEIRHKRRQSE